LVRRIIADARYTPAAVDNTSTMSIETEDELEGLRRAGRINDAAVHGLPTARPLRRGDVVKVDVTAELDGFYADACVTVVCGAASPAARRLVSAADAALRRALPLAIAGARVRDVSAAISAEATTRGVSVLDGLGGHGIGRTIHEEPRTPSTRSSSATAARWC
jgi:methionine aminopeptidase